MFYKDLKTKKVFISKLTLELGARIYDGSVIAIDEDVYNRESGKPPAGAPSCKIFATVSRIDFESFKDRCNKEGKAMDQVLISLVRHYAYGPFKGFIDNRQSTSKELDKRSEV